ncbi:hypothetical protein AHF37_11371 [Paragonimus kellicotti]|nr:hypothetical protein AHF37_11371 [Paragonimus kellicotti]
MCYPQPQTGHCNQLADYLRARVHQLVSVLKTIQLNIRMTTRDLDEGAQAWLEDWGRTLNEVQMSRDGLEFVLPEFNRELEILLPSVEMTHRSGQKNAIQVQPHQRPESRSVQPDSLTMFNFQSDITAVSSN